MVYTRHLKCRAQKACGFESRPAHHDIMSLMSKLHPELNPESIVLALGDSGNTVTVQYYATPGTQVTIKPCDFDRFAGSADCSDNHAVRTAVQSNGTATAEITLLPNDKQIVVTPVASNKYIASRDIHASSGFGELDFIIGPVIWIIIIVAIATILRKLLKKFQSNSD